MMMWIAILFAAITYAIPLLMLTPSSKKSYGGVRGLDRNHVHPSSGTACPICMYNISLREDILHKRCDLNKGFAVYVPKV